MEVEGREVSLTCTGRGSPPLLRDVEYRKFLSTRPRIEYITTKLWSDIGNDGTK